MLVYLDNSSTTRPFDEVTLEVARAMGQDYGNPSSLHRMGIDAEKCVKNARRSIALPIGASPEEILFTGGGTEADNMAIFGLAKALKRRGNKIITSKVEHPAILESCKRLSTMDFDIVYVGVNSMGLIDLQELENEISDKTILISIMHVNNELGTIQPIEEIGQLKRRHEGIVFHSDAIQSYGKLSLDPKKWGVDLMSFSAHKIHGPKGVGALYIKKGIRIEPLLAGGGQENGMRSGTENVPGIAGFGLAAQLSGSNQPAKMAEMIRLRGYFLSEIKKTISDCRINSYETTGSSPAILNISFEGTRGEVLLHMLEQSGIFVSTGSACSSKRRGQSHVLKAAGLSDREIEGAIRFSFSEMTTLAEIDYTLECLKKAVDSIRKTLNR